MTNPNKLQFPDIQQVLNQTALQARTQEPMKSYSVRIQPSIKEHAQAVCEAHGTDISSYLRQCTIALAAIYPGQAKAAEAQKLPDLVADRPDAEE